MKAIDIALKDMTRHFRSFSAVVFMFIIPLPGRADREQQPDQGNSEPQKTDKCAPQG